MHIEINGQVFSVRFEYSSPSGRLRGGKALNKSSTPVTKCVIDRRIKPTGGVNDKGKAIYHWEHIVTGSVKRDHRDKLDKGLGRRLALTDALSVFTKSDRKAFWTAYASSHNDDKSAAILNSLTGSDFLPKWRTFPSVKEIVESGKREVEGHGHQKNPDPNVAVIEKKLKEQG